jgi:hypothetical protein
MLNVFDDTRVHVESRIIAICTEGSVMSYISISSAQCQSCGLVDTSTLHHLGLATWSVPPHFVTLVDHAETRHFVRVLLPAGAKVGSNIPIWELSVHDIMDAIMKVGDCIKIHMQME